MALSNKQRTVLNLLVYENKLKKEAAAAVGVWPDTVSVWFRNPEFSSEYERMLRELHQEMAARATAKLEKLIDDPQSSTALGAVKLTLSIAGYDAPIKQEITQKTITVGFEEEEKEKK